MSDWVTKVLKDRHATIEQQKMEANMYTLALSVSGDMFARLSSRLRSDIQQFSEVSGVAIKVDPASQWAFACSRQDRFPVFNLRLERDMSAPIIHVSLQAKDAADQELIVKTYDISIIAKAQNQYFFAHSGNEYDQDKTSEMILAPIFRGI